MSYQQKDNSGALFKNEDKQEDTHADYRGSITVAGVDYFIDAWVNVAQSGRKYFGLRVKEKQQQGQQADQPRGHSQARMPPQRTSNRPGSAASYGSAGRDDGDIPF